MATDRAYDMDPGQFASGYLGMEPGQPLPERRPVDGMEARAVMQGARLTTRPQYTSEHRWLLSNLPTEHLVRIQEALERAGFSRKMVFGALDDATIENWVALLGVANREGSDWQSTLGRLSSGTDGLEAPEEEVEFAPETYVSADPVAMAQSVRDLMKKQLKREPTEREVDELVKELGGIDRMRHEQEQELAELQFNAQQEGDPSLVPEEHQEIDPSARFRQLFEERYSGELDHLEDVDEQASQREALEANVAATDRYVRS